MVIAKISWGKNWGCFDLQILWGKYLSNGMSGSWFVFWWWVWWWVISCDFGLLKGVIGLGSNTMLMQDNLGFPPKVFGITTKQTLCNLCNNLNSNNNWWCSNRQSNKIVQKGIVLVYPDPEKRQKRAMLHPCGACHRASDAKVRTSSPNMKNYA